MAETLHFELVSPERLLMSAEVEMVVVPGAEGDFGVMPRHAPLVSTLRAGVIEVWEDGAVTRRIYARGGFAEVTTTGLTILAEEAVPVAEIDRERLAQRMCDAEEDLRDAKDDDRRHRAGQEIERLQAMVDAAA